MIYGYIRENVPFSTKTQAKIMLDYRCDEIVVEANTYTERSEFNRLMAKMHSQDKLVITSLSVFSHSSVEVAKMLKILREKEIELVSWSYQFQSTERLLSSVVRRRKNVTKRKKVYMK